MFRTWQLFLRFLPSSLCCHFSTFFLIFKEGNEKWITHSPRAVGLTRSLICLCPASCPSKVFYTEFFENLLPNLKTGTHTHTIVQGFAFSRCRRRIYCNKCNTQSPYYNVGQEKEEALQCIPPNKETRGFECILGYCVCAQGIPLTTVVRHLFSFVVEYIWYSPYP